MIDLRAEWNRCTLARGHEPTADEWYQWTTDILEQVRASEPNTEIKRLRAALSEAAEWFEEHGYEENAIIARKVLND